MDILSHFNKTLENNFNLFLKNYFYESNFWYKNSDINNYINFMSDIDSFSYNFITNVIKSYFEYIDSVFFNTSYRKNFCSSKGFYSRTILTMFGEITFKRRYYFDKKTNERFFFTDYFLNLPKRKYFDPFVCAEICNEASSSSYSKTGKIVSDKIGKRINNNLSISRASSRNIVMNFDFDIQHNEVLRKVERLYIMLDEKFVGSQFNDGKDHMIKAAVLFEDSQLVYKYKKKPDSMNRFKLVNSHTCASIDNNLLSDTLNYIYYNYEIENLKELNFMGDCANWIKTFPKSQWFKFNKNIKINFAMDGFHFSQALRQLTTESYADVYDALYEYVLFNKKDDFIRLCNEFLELNINRKEVIENKRDYILNNWNARQLYQNSPHMKCSMESHISHIFADIFTSRPKSYSEKGLRKLLKLRLLKINNINIKEKYFETYKSKEKKINNSTSIIKTIKDTSSEIKKYLNQKYDNYINYFV